MKKVIAIVAIAALVACGGASTEATTDSAATTVDTAAATVDTAATVAPAKEDAEIPVSNEAIK
jgi:outer membrane murein-binding lipoprotein Lpp